MKAVKLFIGLAFALVAGSASAQDFSDPQYAVTAGFGFPLKFMGTSSIDVSLEYGLRGSHALMSASPKIGMIRQDYFKVGLGFSLFGEDYWFVRPKYD